MPHVAATFDTIYQPGGAEMKHCGICELAFGGWFTLHVPSASVLHFVLQLYSCTLKRRLRKQTSWPNLL
jgi:hypothetical protein